jgi:hypothetical protein
VTCVVVLSMIRTNGLGNKDMILGSEFVFMIRNCCTKKLNFVLVAA